MSQKFYVGDEVFLDTRYRNKIRTTIKGTWVWGWKDRKNIEGLLYDERAIMVFLEEMLFRYNNELPTVIMNDGDERTGKSTFSILCNRIYKSPAFQDRARYKEIINRPDWTIDEFLDCSPLDIKDVCFEKKDLQEQMRIRQMGDMTWLIEDEAGHQLFAQEWWDKVQRTLVKNLQVTAKKRQIIMLNLPHFLDLTAKIRGRAAKMYCHCEMMEDSNSPSVERGFVEIRRAKRQRWEQEIYWEPFYAFRFRKLEGAQQKEYDGIKDAFIQLVDEEKEEDKTNVWKERYLKTVEEDVKAGVRSQNKCAIIGDIDPGDLSRELKKRKENP